jgi:hypothetical protein
MRDELFGWFTCCASEVLVADEVVTTLDMLMLSTTEVEVTDGAVFTFEARRLLIRDVFVGVEEDGWGREHDEEVAPWEVDAGEGETADEGLCAGCCALPNKACVK